MLNHLWKIKKCKKTEDKCKRNEKWIKYAIDFFREEGYKLDKHLQKELDNYKNNFLMNHNNTHKIYSRDEVNDLFDSISRLVNVS